MSSDPGPWGRRVAVGVGLWFVVCAVALFFGMKPHPVLVALVVAAVGGAIFLFLDTSAQAPSTAWRLPDRDPARRPGEDPRLALLARVLNTHLVSHEAGDQLHRHLMSLADQRLVAHHGISRRADPDRAAAVMGPDLAAFAAHRVPHPRLTTDQIDLLIDRIEDL